MNGAWGLVSRRSELWFGLLLFIVLALMPLTGSPYMLYLNAQLLCMILAATSLNLLVGYAGLFSYGHVAYFGLGAYTFAILSRTLHTSFGLAFISGPIVAGLLALIFGYFCVRLTKIYFSMLTLAFAQIVWALCYKWIALTGGDSGLAGIPLPAFLGDPLAIYYFIFIVVVVLVVGMYQLTHSPFGLILNTVRENPNRSEAIGINVKLCQMVAFVIAGCVAGFAGALFAINTRAVFPDMMLVTRSIELMIMVILGGMFQFWGPAIGAVVLVNLNVFIKAHTEYWPLALGLLLAVIVMFLPTGIAGIFARGFEKRRGRSASGRAAAVAEDSGGT